MKPKAYDEMSETEDHHWWFVARRKILLSKLKSLKLPADAKILEVGVGTGGNLEMLSAFGDVQGIEMNKDAIALANKKTGGAFKIHQGMCPDGIPKFNQKFDLICMFDVLEHVEKDTETLSAIRPLLKENGQLIITVPAYQWLWSMHDEHLHHQRRYTITKLRHDAETSGWKTMSSSYFNFMLFPVIALIRLKDKMLKNENFAGPDAPREPINGILTKIFGFESHILRWIKMPFGVSIMATFKSQ
jgi:SAM-dependent methyltransferase